MGIRTHIQSVAWDYARFSKVVVVGSPPRGNTSLASGTITVQGMISLLLSMYKVQLIFQLALEL